MFRAIVVSMMLVMVAARAAGEPSGFILSVDTAAPGSAALQEGNYSVAIRHAKTALRLGESRSTYLTLCAAYIGQAALEEAVVACDEAVSAAKAPLTTERMPHGHRDRDGLAKAYSNRAVLRALRGDVAAAAADLESAAQQNRHEAVVRNNAVVIERAALMAQRRSE